MFQFKNKKISLNSENLAEQLVSARQKKNKSIEEIAKELKINKKYLEALEKGNFNQLPEGLYGQGFLKEYASYLNLNLKEVLELFNSEKNQEKNKRKELFIQKKARAHYFLSLPKIFKNILIIFLILLCLIYIGHYINNIIAPPTLIVFSPPQDAHTNKHIIQITGISDPDAEVIINGKKILLEDKGHFKMDIHLKKGLNEINIVSQKKYSKKNIINRKIIMEP